jgi:hypothetical protein
MEWFYQRAWQCLQQRQGKIAKSAYQILLIPSPYLLHFRLGKGVFDHFGLVVSDQCDAKGNNI